MKIPNSIKLLLSILISGLFIATIYHKVEWQKLGETFQQTNTGALAVYFGLFVPQLLVAGWRWTYILNRINQCPTLWSKSFQMVLGGYSANLFIPAKMGEIVRIFWIPKEKSKYPPLIVVLYEKIWDLFSVFTLSTVGLLLVKDSYPQISRLLYIFIPLNILGIVTIYLGRNILRRMIVDDTSKVGRILSIFKQPFKASTKILAISLILWGIQLFQFHYMFQAFNIDLSVLASVTGGGWSVLAGAVVPSIGGIGPRDATLLWFFHGIITREVLVSVGIISIFRIIIPAVIGFPFLISYFAINKNGLSNLEHRKSSVSKNTRAN